MHLSKFTLKERPSSPNTASHFPRNPPANNSSSSPSSNQALENMPPRPANSGRAGLPTVGAHITTVGVKRPDFGTGGQPTPIYVNSFQTTIPNTTIHHYDGKSTWFLLPNALNNSFL
ncbi:Argonaute-like protein [Mycena chlorophos]|uniref:Argonaute-like protein n=1 Tax=Mycena chlorophos TaxID=658473 RepID=A0A8H6VW68_MYCCL|nr:Argonaute-like protein [Mycena chlorophos]